MRSCCSLRLRALHAPRLPCRRHVRISFKTADLNLACQAFMHRTTAATCIKPARHRSKDHTAYLLPSMAGAITFGGITDLPAVSRAVSLLAPTCDLTPQAHPHWTSVLLSSMPMALRTGTAPILPGMSATKASRAPD